MPDAQTGQIQKMTKQIADQLRLLQQPLDLDSLERDGLVVREGRRHLVPRLGALPDHVTAKIASITQSNGKIYVTFRRTGSKVDNLVKKLEKLGF